MADPGYGRRGFLKKLLALGAAGFAVPSLVTARAFDSKDFAWKELGGSVVLTGPTIRGSTKGLKDVDTILKDMYLPVIRRQMEQDGALLKLLNAGWPSR